MIVFTNDLLERNFYVNNYLPANFCFNSHFPRDPGLLDSLAFFFLALLGGELLERERCGTSVYGLDILPVTQLTVRSNEGNYEEF